MKIRTVSEASLRRALDHPLLSREKEAALARRIKSGDEAARHELVRHNLRLAWAFASRAEPGGGPKTQDLFAEAITALYQSTHRFDPVRGGFAKFCGFRLRAAWRRHARFQGYPQARSLRAVQGKGDQSPACSTTAKAGRDGSPGFASFQRPASMLGSAQSSDWVPVENLPDETAERPDAAALNADLRDSVCRSRGMLDPRTRAVIERRFGFEPCGPADLPPITRRSPLRSVGASLGLSGERVRQLEREGLAILRRVLNGQRFAANRWRP